MHLRITIQKSDGVVEHIEVDHRFFHAKVNHVDKRNFDRQLENISPCLPKGTDFEFKGANMYYSINLHTLYVFTWEYETINGHT